MQNFSGGPVDRTSNRQIYENHFTQVPLLKKLVDTFETMFPYLSIDLVWLLHKSKKVMDFRGGTKTFCWVNKSPRLPIVINVGSKERDNEVTTGSFNNDVSFKGR
jgi:hypothetical protein